ncbi:MAG: Crp/Fnr family transcriptional regulator [Pseudomonadota bacterium]
MMQEHRHSIAEILSRQPLFQGLSEAELQQVAQATREYRVSRNEILFQKGQAPLGMHLVVMGQIKLSIPSPQGGEKVMHLANPGQSFGEAVTFLDRPYPVSAQATQDSIVLLIDKDRLLEAIDASPRLARKMLASLSMRLHELMVDIESCALRSSLQKVAGYLLQGGGASQANRYQVELPSSKQTLAAHLNLAPETLSRVLGQLSKKGLIAVHGRSIDVLDRQQLAQVAA